MELVKNTLTKLSTATIFILAIYLVYLSKTALLFVVIAIFLALAISPVVELLEKKNFSKVGASVLSMFVLFGIILGIITAILTPLITQGRSLLQNLPEITEHVTTNATLVGYTTKYNISESLTELSHKISSMVVSSAPSLLSLAGHIAVIASSTVVVLVLTFLFLIEGQEMWANLLHFFKPKDQLTLRKVGKEIRRAIGGFISGNLIISLIAGIVTAITLFVLHVPYVFALAALVALFDLIPLIGAAIATAAVGFVALTQGITVALIVVFVLLTYQFVEGHFIQPVVYSRSINLSPLFIVLASIIGAEIAGIAGVLLAIPVGAIFQIISKELYKHYIRTEGV